MPVTSYFKGKGDKVMRDMVKTHGSKKGKRVFYATAKKQGMAPVSHLPPGTSLSPKGDLGIRRAKENAAAGGFTDGTAWQASKHLPGGPHA